MRSVEYCTGLFVWGLEVCGGGLRCWGLCVFVIKCLRGLCVFSVVVGLDSGNGCVEIKLNANLMHEEVVRSNNPQISIHM